jgi:hypothetical protein
MSEEPLTLHADERRLAAILAADVAGYSRLMGRNEVATVRDLEGASVQERCRTWRRTWRLGNLSTPHDVQKLPMASHAKDGVRSCP